MKKLTFNQINALITEVENELLKGKRIPFTFDRNWSANFNSAAGVYAIFDKDKLVYVGESANVRERMKELKRTVNHSFRRKLGKHLDAGATVVNGKFNAPLEQRLDEYYLDNISICAVDVDFGRLEIENNMIDKHRNKGLLNSEDKRKATQFI